MASDLLPSGYAAWLTRLKARVTAARTRAALAVNAEAIRLYHDIGLELLVRRNDATWGDKVLDTLSRDLRAAFPDMKGFSVRNLKYMRYFAEKCPDGSIGQQAAAQLPWFHIVLLLTKTNTATERDWYATRAAVDRQIKSAEDNPTIGLLLCKTHDRLVAEYALSDVSKPIGIAEYQLVRALPNPLDTRLPSVETLEAELAANLKELGYGE